MKKQRLRVKQIALSGALLLSLGGCLSTAEMMGYDTQTLNNEAAKSYVSVVNKAHSEGVLDTNSVTAKRIKVVFNRMVPYAVAENKTGVPFNWQLNVIRSNELNAWAMPGGKMVFYTAIVEKLNLTDAEIAAIMGHEMTHALLEHSKAAAGQKVLTNAALSIGGSVLASKTNMSSNSINATKELLGQYGLTLPFSRYQESQADSGGLNLMAKAGYDPHAAVTLWEKMSQQSGKNIPAILSTHPSHQSRIDAMTKSLPEVMPVYEQALAQRKVAPKIVAQKSQVKAAKKRR